jgi:hypothetical protein
MGKGLTRTVKDSEVFLVAVATNKPLDVVENEIQRLFAGLRQNLERMKEQPKYPAIPDEDPE